MRDTEEDRVAIEVIYEKEKCDRLDLKLSDFSVLYNNILTSMAMSTMSST